MKKRLLFIPMLFIPFIASCNSPSGKMRISYGTYIENETLTDIDYASLKRKMEGDEKGENFLLATYYPNSHCTCWGTFKTVLEKYVKEYHTRIYTVSTGYFDSSRNDFGLTIMHVDTPTFAIIENGKIKKEYIYNDSNMFKQSSVLREELNKFIVDPNLYFVTRDYLDNAITSNEKTLAYYEWSFCPDCQYVNPNVLLPYSHKNDFDTKMYIVDIGELTMTDGTFDTFDTSNSTYQNYLKTHHINEEGDSTFGYGRGFVPTFQYYEKGILKDMDVFFNDELTLINDEYVVTRSYFSEERSKHLSYLDNVEVKVLEGLKINKTDVDDSGSWLKSSSSKYHSPLLKAFLDKYAK